MKKLRNRGWYVHAPCVISDIQEDERSVTFTVDGWGGKPYYILISGINKEPKDVGVREVRGLSAKALGFKSAGKEFHSEHNYLVITTEGKSEIRIR